MVSLGHVCVVSVRYCVHSETLEAAGWLHKQKCIYIFKTTLHSPPPTHRPGRLWKSTSKYNYMFASSCVFAWLGNQRGANVDGAWCVFGGVVGGAACGVLHLYRWPPRVVGGCVSIKQI